MRSAPARSASATCSPRRAKSAARMDGASLMDVLFIVLLLAWWGNALGEHLGHRHAFTENWIAFPVGKLACDEGNQRLRLDRDGASSQSSSFGKRGQATVVLDLDQQGRRPVPGAMLNPHAADVGGTFRQPVNPHPRCSLRRGHLPANLDPR